MKEISLTGMCSELDVLFDDSNDTKKPTQPTAILQYEVELDEHQQKALDSIKSGNNTFITGQAGTGKSVIFRKMKELYPDALVTASTGIAAVNVGASTVHSAFSLGLCKSSPETIIRYISKDTVHRLTRLKRLMIDEVSMLNVVVWETVDTILRILRNNNTPFGGVQLILFGDFCQLPPVPDASDAEVAFGTGNQGQFIFKSTLWDEAKITTVVLKKIYRQSDIRFQTALSMFRYGIISPDMHLILDERRRATVDQAKPPIVVFTTNKDVDRLNSEKLATVPGAAFEYEATDIFDVYDDAQQDKVLAQLSKTCLAPKYLKLKVGARVMLLRNIDVSIGLANGSLGTVTGLGSSKIVVMFDNNQEVNIEKAQWEHFKGPKRLALRSQYPLRLAYAITAHKSQGMTLSSMYADMSNIFEWNQAYTILSRAASIAGLFLRIPSMDQIQKWKLTHPDALTFYSHHA